MIEPAARAILIADPDVARIVTDRVWFALRPQGERQPGVVITCTGGADPGALDDNAGYVTGTLDVTCLAPTYQAAKELAGKVTTALNDFEGVIADTKVDWFNISDQSDVPVIPPEGKASPQTFGVLLSVDFMYST